MSNPRTVLITGCSRGGLGSALALAFQRAGLRVLATGRSISKLAHLEQMKIESLALDITDQDSISACVNEVSKRTGNRLDILVNNAGAMYTMPLSDTSIPESRALFELNVLAYLSVTQAFLPLLLNAHGTVVNNTSASSITTVPYHGVYNASKAAAAILTDTLRLELAPFDIKVVELKTSAVKSSLYVNRQPSSAIQLPESSIFTIARDPVEKAMNDNEAQDNASSADDWAEQVVKEILKTKPEHKIWKGKNASAVRAAKKFIPDALRDGHVSKVGALDEVETAVRHRWVDRARVAASMMTPMP